MGKVEEGDSAPENSQPDVAASNDAASSDTPAKKLARQLDFSGFGRMTTSGVLPDNPHSQSQTQLQSRSQLPLVAVSQSQAQLPPPPQSQPRMVVIPVSSSPRVPKPDSPKSRARSNIEAKDCTPKKPKQCNCKHSRCLKLYCECFASGIYCDGCNCINCYNNVENDAARREAVELTLERNPNAFRPKIANSPHGTRDNRNRLVMTPHPVFCRSEPSISHNHQPTSRNIEEEAGEVLMLAKHNKGCHCKKSGCLKKYCECFQANILCSENCKCMDCKNFEGSEERQALFHGDHGNNIVYIQQAANAAITGAIGSSGYASPPVSKKRKGQELLFGHTLKDPAIHRLGQFQQENQIRTSIASLPSIPATRAGSNGALGPSKVTYRSLLADIIQPHDVKELCSVLVVQSSENAKTLTDQRNAAERTPDNQIDTSLASSAHDRLQNEKDSAEKAINGDCFSANQDNIIKNDNSNSEEGNVPKGRPVSPGTLALMCDEDETMFIQSAFPNGIVGKSCSTSSQMPCEQELSEVYPEQERSVLTKFRDCLNRLITFGKIKETECSFQARNEAENLCNGSMISRTEGRSQHQHEPIIINGTGRITGQASPKANSSSVIHPDDLRPKIQSLPENGESKQKGEKQV